MTGAPFGARKSLGRRILRRLILIIAVPILGYGLIIALWILLAPPA